MTHRYILRASWAFVIGFILCSCSRSTRSTTTRTATIIAKTITTATSRSVAWSGTPNLTSFQTPTSHFTKTSSLTQAPSLTLKPTATPSATLPPAPTDLPTRTPTFDAYHLTTATPLTAEVCPEVNPDAIPPDFEAIYVPPFNQHFQQYHLDYFNHGGIVSNLPAYWQPDYTVDLTHDGVSEFIIQAAGDVYILGCHSGKYQLLLDVRYDGSGAGNYVREIKDANQNGLPEVIARVILTPYIESFNVFEWDGTQFRSRLTPNDRNVTENGLFQTAKGRADLSFKDMDSDSLLELRVFLRPPYHDHDNYIKGFPWRNEIDAYKWNGSKYVFLYRAYDAPFFRFQAVHDGDWAFLRGEYDQAKEFYKQAIYDDNLYWYTEERRLYLLVNDSIGKILHVTPTHPVYNPDEYPNLAAYANFRMMLVEIKRERFSRAQIIYDWLQTNFLPDTPGHVYAELATLFWSEYQKSQDFGLSCTATYAYASSHPEEIFRYLTTQLVINKKLISWPNPINFGSQGSELEYSPAMICPSE
jgi:hypothetical protein